MLGSGFRLAALAEAEALAVHLKDVDVMAYPALKVIVRDATRVVLQDELLSGQHDLIVTQLPVPSDDAEVMRLFRDR